MTAIQQSLKFDPVIFLLQIISFLILVQVMTRLFWRPILSHIANRKQEIDTQYRTRDGLQSEMEHLRSSYLDRISAVEAEARSKIQSVVREAQNERERALGEARTQAEEALREGIALIEKEQVESLHSMRSGMARMAAEVASRAIGMGTDVNSITAAVNSRIEAETGERVN